ncbi:MAG: DUF3667 domain-containing protein [Sphingobacteriales bacterium]|nr:MAG: DUF3667 domain-containing protein [Sphingobacteriales bacterium]
MSHAKERAEKICLNCGAELKGRYCHRCGQENIEPKESFWHLVTHFFYDITHFDGKFFETVKILLFNPGFLTRQYMAGKRVSYLNPIRMYVFTSAIFFLIFFTFMTPEETLKISETKPKKSPLLVEILEEAKNNAKQELTTIKDSSEKADKEKEIAAIEHDLKRLATDSTITGDSLQSVSGIFKYKKKNPFEKRFETVEAYDSVQNTLKGDAKDSWLEQFFTRKKIMWDKKYGEGHVMEALKEKFLHSIPQLLFVSLPFFALLLKLLYIRRKKYYYVDHGIFSIHLYCAIFIILLFIFGLEKLKVATQWNWMSTLIGIVILSVYFYVYIAMKKYYEQGYLKTFLKYCILFILYPIVAGLLMMVFLLLSIFRL